MTAIAPMIAFTVPGRPVPWSRAGSNKGKRYTPAKQSAYMAVVRTMALSAMSRTRQQPIAGPVELAYRATYRWPETWSQKDRDRNGKWRIGRADVENLTKLVCDAMNGIVYLDDAQIVSLKAQKVYGLPTSEGVTISVISLTENLVEA